MIQGGAIGWKREVLGFAGFLFLSFSVAAVGSAVTAPAVATWYAALAKPAFNPPNAVFAPVWTILFFFIAVAGWRIWRRHGFGGAPSATILYSAQLALNLLWSILFFGLHLTGAALADVVVLFACIVAAVLVFHRLDGVAALLFVPYALWVGFAAILNAAIWVMN